jgi:hypothetical protein
VEKPCHSLLFARTSSLAPLTQNQIRFRALGATLVLWLAAACSPVSLPDAGVRCPDGTIDTHGGCALRRPNGQACNAATACASGYCTDGVCCEAACAGPCQRCDQSGQCVAEAQLSVEPGCGAYVCGEGKCLTSCTRDSHCAADAHCENRQCVAARGNGAFCSADNQCRSKHCADGYCCDQTCDDSCDACNLAGSEGTCSAVTVGTPGAPSCGSFLCDGIKATCPSGCASDATCGAGYFCNAQGACAPRRATGTTCAESRECLTGFCADGYCCDSACSGACDVCNAQGDEGTCRLAAAGSDGKPSCSPFVCTGQSAQCPPTCTTDFDCSMGRFCAAGGCQLQKLNGQVCAQGRECGSGFCTDGVCCDQQCGGQCDSCNQTGSVGQCTLSPLSATGNPSCSPYSCNGLTANCGLACTTVGPGAPCSASEWCDGVACARKGALGTVCTQNYQCLSSSCVDGYCCDNACSGACDTCSQRGFEGTCKPNPAGTVVAVCGAYVCDGLSGACPAACNGDQQCAAGRWCDNGACVPQRTQGQSCVRNTACTTGQCADGFCCNQGCGESCDVCNLPGLEGSCVAASAGATPAPACGLFVCGGLSVACPTTCRDDNDCAQTAWCNNGNCEPQRPLGHACVRDRACTQGHCADGLCCDSACGESCDTCGAQPGTCTVRTKGSVGAPTCTPFVCDGVQASCPQSCNDNLDCATGYYCTGPGGVCAVKLPDGALCGTNNAVCLSGNCADGYCCNAPCQGACESCATNPGTCTAYPEGNPGAPSCGAYACNGASGNCPNSCPGTPNLQLGCASTHFCVSGLCTPKRGLGDGCFDGAECGTGFCVDGVCCNTGCSGACDVCNLTPGTCTPAGAGSAGSPTCYPYLCDGTATSCPTTCGGNGACATNDCNGGVCRKLQLGNTCETSFECASNCCDSSSLQCAAGPSNCR